MFGAVGQVRNGWIDDVSPKESEILKAYFQQVIVENHDLQVRFRWGKDDLAIWDKCVHVSPALRNIADNRTAAVSSTRQQTTITVIGREIAS